MMLLCHLVSLEARIIDIRHVETKSRNGEEEEVNVAVRFRAKRKGMTHPAIQENGPGLTPIKNLLNVGLSLQISFKLSVLPTCRSQSRVSTISLSSETTTAFPRSPDELA